MIRVILTDTHYGWKQNSVTWLDYQMKFLDEQLIPFLEKQTDDVRLIHMGDVFDSRSSISPMVAKAVRERFIKMRSLVKDFVIIAGNHDFYSPNSDEIESLSMVFRDMGITLVINESVIMDEDMFIPWYQYKEFNKRPDGVKNIYTHADIFGEDRKMIPGIKLFSGHVHIPQIDENRGWYSIGSCYNLNFADSNSARGFYIYKDGIEFVPNEVSIKFWRLYNDDIFKESDEYGSQDYYEFYIDQNNMQMPIYQSKLTELTKQYKNTWVIPVIQSSINECEHFESYNIEEICKSLIPEHLQDKFRQVEEATIKSL